MKHRSFPTPPLSFRSLVIVAALSLLPSATFADWQTGVEAFKKGDFASAETVFRELAEAQPDWYGGHFMLGRVLLEQGHTARALSSLQRAHALETRPEVTLLLARTALDEGQKNLVRSTLVASPPQQLSAEQRIAWFRLRAGAASNHAERLRDLGAAADLAPKDLHLRIRLADAAKDAGRLEEAIRHLELADELSPTNEAVLVRQLKVRLAQSESASSEQKARMCHLAAEAAADAAAVTGRAKHLSLAGRSYRCADDLGRAESYFQQALEAQPSWRAAYDLANVQLKQEDWEAAEETLLPWLEGEGEGSARLHQLAGRALEGQQRFLDAIPHYEIAGDTQGIAHAKEGQAALDHNRKQQQLQDEIDALEGQIGDLEDDEADLH
ncbi:MAG: tetratricopeptide repeat protein [Thermoanaerobaculia bacterium]|nr:tetratricopeptide repeat protein [Thermoanaerobaculia bacterium]